jgi:glycosyltransferase involved in cell wall biosynthesis
MTTTVELNEPLVSYLILSYNYGHTIGRAINSALEQTYQNIEIVVIDDFSTDNSIEIIKAFNDPRVKLVRNPRNLGGSQSFNAGLAHCTGKYISNLDADDSHHKDKTRLSVDFLESNPSISILGTWVQARNLDGSTHPNSKDIESLVNTSVDLNRISSWIWSNTLSRSSSLVRRSVYDSIGRSDPDMTFAPDYEFWTRALAAGYKFSVLPEILTLQSYHRGSVTNSNPLEAFIELCYAIGRNLSPLAFIRGELIDVEEIISGAVGSEQLLCLPPNVGNFLIGNLLWNSNYSNFAQFRLAMEESDLGIEKLGTYARHHKSSGFSETLEEPKTQVDDTTLMVDNLIGYTQKRSTVPYFLASLRKREYFSLILIMFGTSLSLLESARSFLRGKKIPGLASSKEKAKRG